MFFDQPVSLVLLLQELIRHTDDQNVEKKSLQKALEETQVTITCPLDNNLLLTVNTVLFLLVSIKHYIYHLLIIFLIIKTCISYHKDLYFLS